MTARPLEGWTQRVGATIARPAPLRAQWIAPTTSMVGWASHSGATFVMSATSESSVG
ncbi:hypothetical protein [Natronococcus wangiae]|uniref:hypothetical protein n=1 Tax=Natronococcus wangiae TaxID=3068275 RepID=UPI00273D4E44|nr:hypothetical protein [Natronococcus sp. AD5]